MALRYWYIFINDLVISHYVLVYYLKRQRQVNYFARDMLQQGILIGY